MSTPAPIAWMTHATINTPKLGAMAATIDPTKNVPIAAKYKGLVLILSIKYAVRGIMTPLTSINPVTSHCDVLSLIFNSLIILGNAVFNNV